MYSPFQLAKKYLNYYISAFNGKGHGIHSPFVFDFVKNVLNDKRKYDCYRQIENLRGELLRDESSIRVEDFGAGSSIMRSNERKIEHIARSSLKNKKFAQLLFRIIKYYKPGNILELGTSLGITTAYMASAFTKVSGDSKSPDTFTLEGSKNIAAVAQNNFEKLNLKNIKLIQGNFDDTLPGILSQIKNIDLGFVDGNHRKQPTLNYFYQLLSHSTDSTILIFDDIHWSKEMEEAWKEIQQHASVTLSIDLFFIGLIFFKKDFKATQHFTIRF
jgi:predicted O-methyltransferase YrrM